LLATSALKLENNLLANYRAICEVASVRIIKDKETRRSKVGFVEMPNDNEANAAIAALNGTITRIATS